MSERESWHKEIDLFLVAMGYFTRIPMPKWVEVDADKLNKASRYFGLVGLLVGLLSAIVFWLTQNWLPAGVSVLLAMVTGVLLTGGFHEDGLADTFDGFGGGRLLIGPARQHFAHRLLEYRAHQSAAIKTGAFAVAAPAVGHTQKTHGGDDQVAGGQAHLLAHAIQPLHQAFAGQQFGDGVLRQIGRCLARNHGLGVRRERQAQQEGKGGFLHWARG